MSFLTVSGKCKLRAKKEVWTKKQQEWWHEEAKGDLETTAAICRECRDKKKHEKDKLLKNIQNGT